MMLEHLGENPAADRLMKAVERVTANKSLHTPDLGGKATTKQVTDAVCEALRSAFCPICRLVASSSGATPSRQN
jgi:tartrate dehydrogenase/decarboxylase / D-malate dehydrogenase